MALTLRMVLSSWTRPEYSQIGVLHGLALSHDRICYCEHSFSEAGGRWSWHCFARIAWSPKSHLNAKMAHYFYSEWIIFIFCWTQFLILTWHFGCWASPTVFIPHTPPLLAGMATPPGKWVAWPSNWFFGNCCAILTLRGSKVTAAMILMGFPIPPKFY